jgi:hypothetical protein
MYCELVVKMIGVWNHFLCGLQAPNKSGRARFEELRRSHDTYDRVIISGAPGCPEVGSLPSLWVCYFLVHFDTQKNVSERPSSGSTFARCSTLLSLFSAWDIVPFQYCDHAGCGVRILSYLNTARLVTVINDVQP